MIETRPYFLLGDLFANAGVGALASSVVTWLGLPSWPMAAGMVAGMLVGMIIGLAATLAVLSALFGAMEVFVPCMLGGMLAGMIGAMGPVRVLPPPATGALIGVATLILVYIANALLSGERRMSE
jgi:hypothetical protein